jgi:hypothetical protein
VTCPLDFFPTGLSTQVIVSVTVRALGTLVCSATVSSDPTDADPSDNTATSTLQLAALAPPSQTPAPSPPRPAPTPAGQPAAATTAGTVLVNGSRFTSGPVPYGALINVSHGTISMKTRVGTIEVSGVGGSTIFVLSKSSENGKPLDVIRLEGGNFGVCGSPGSSTRGKRGVVAKKPPAATTNVRGVRTDATGRFRVDGRWSYTTVRGTVFAVIDRCDGTLTQVTRGRVDVYDLPHRKHVFVSSHHSYLARKA